MPRNVLYAKSISTLIFWSALFLVSAPAYAAPPEILSPTGSVTTTEGDALVLPFIVHEPDNDVVEYTVKYVKNDVVQPSLPTGAVFETDPKTAERRLVWWPDLTQAGSYDFRFLATDEYGARDEKVVTVTVTDRTKTPALKVEVYGTTEAGYPKWSGVGPFVIKAYPETADIGIIASSVDPEGQPVTVSVSGLTNLQQLSPTQWRWQYPAEGSYTITVTATDTDSNTTTVTIPLEVRRAFVDTVEIHPEIRNGLQRMAGGTAIVQGRVTFGLKGFFSWANQESFPIPAGMQYRYVLHTPDLSGNDRKTYLSDILTGPQTAVWDSGSVPDGTYAVDLEVVSPDPANTRETAMERFYLRPLVLVVDNNPGAVIGAQWLPIAGSVGMRSWWTESAVVDWVRFSGAREFPNPHPYPYEFIPAPKTDAKRQALLKNDLSNGGSWFAETWNNAMNARYDPWANFTRIKEGHVTISNFTLYATGDPVGAGSFSDFLWRYPVTDGPRNVGGFINSTRGFRPNPMGPGFYGVSPDGRLFRLDPDGTVTTLAGLVTRRDILPFLPDDLVATREDYLRDQWELKGRFEGGIPFNFPWDIVFDPADPTKAYVADSGNNRIALVDLSGPEAVVTTFAGKAGEAGYAEGDRLKARFSGPKSVEIVGRTLYVVDMLNFRLRAIDLTTGMVTTVVGKTPNPPLPYIGDVEANKDAYTWGRVSFDEAILVYPFWIRRFSNGDLALLEAGYPGTGNLRRIRFAEQIVEQIVRTHNGYGFDVDWRGNVGLVDSILDAHNHELRRIAPDGTITPYVINDTGSPPYYNSNTGYTGRGEGGAYPLAIVIDDEEPRIGYHGQYQSGLVVLRPPQPGDPMIVDATLTDRGRDVYYLGTIPEFYPANSRPSLAALHGRKGYNWLGNQLLFDDLAELTDSQLAAYIQAGMDSHFPRTELTGRHLRDLIYQIRVHSVQGKQELVSPAAIAANLEAAGYYGPNGKNDLRLTEIRNIQLYSVSPTTVELTFDTDEPAIGVLKHGPTDYYGLSTEVGPGYAKTHAALLRNLPAGQAGAQHLQFVMKDAAGNLTTTKDATLSGGTPLSDDGQAPVISEVAAANVTPTGAEITWTTNEPATSRVDYGPTSSYGSTRRVWDWLRASHTMTLVKLTPNTLYHLKVCSKNAFEREACSNDFTFTTPESSSGCLRGDTDGNGAITLTDATKLIRILLGLDPTPDPGTEAFCRADCNADGKLSIADVTCIIHKLLGR